MSNLRLVTVIILSGLFSHYDVILGQLPGEPLNNMQNPPGVVWKQIETPRFHVIFPDEISRDAQYVTNVLEHLYRADSKTLGVLPRRVPLVMHNRNTISNGFVSLAPRRMEWFNTPPQVGLIHCVPWYDLLAIHEFRHVVQFEKTWSGFNRLLYYLMGEMGWLAGAAFSTPLWAWEGDAVVMETALTRGGRGRMPEFTMPIRTMLLSGKKYSYYKMTLGSYKNWVADPYSYGYLFNLYIRRKFGLLIWPGVWSTTSDFSVLPYRFSWALSRHTGKGVMKTHADMLTELDSLWQIQTRDKTITPARTLNRSNKGFLTYYLYPQAVNDGSVIVYKLGLADQGAFVRIYPDGREKVLLFPNSTEGTPHSVVNDVMVWTETINDPRWGYQDYSVIQSYNLKTGKKTTLSKQSRYFAPCLSPDGTAIAVVAFERDNSCYIVLLDAKTGQVHKKLPNPDKDFLMTPRWSSDGQKLVYNRLNKKGRALSIIDLASNEITDVIPFGDTFSALPIFYQHYVLFNGDWGGINNIFAVDLETKQVFQVTSRPFGAFNPCVSRDGSKLFFNDYDIAGYHLAEMECVPLQWLPIDSLRDQNIRYYEPLLKQEAGVDFLDHIPQKEWPIKKYSSWKNLFTPHSWIFEGDALAEAYGISILSRNLLGTLQSSVGFQYNHNERNGHLKAGLSYGGYFPIIDVNGLYGTRASTYRDHNDSVRIYTWSEKTLNFGVRLPLDLSRNGYSTMLQFQARLAFTHIGAISDPAGFEEETNKNGCLRSMKYHLNFTRGRRAYADIMPVWGQTFQLSFRHTPLAGDYHGQALTVNTSGYFPGFMKRHGLRVGCAYERQMKENYRFSSEFLFPRGYQYQAHETFFKLSLDYAFPLFYPDQNIWALLYFQRLKSTLFFDYGEGHDVAIKLYRSIGTELTTDVNILSLPVPLEIGGRWSYGFDRKNWRLELMMGLSL